MCTCPDLPASYLEGGCGFSFADGHAEIHKWTTSALLIPVVPRVRLFGVQPGVQNVDWLWLRDHASCRLEALESESRGIDRFSINLFGLVTWRVFTSQS